MATTTNRGWTTPDSTDPISEGADAIDSLADEIDSDFGRFDIKGDFTQVNASSATTQTTKLTLSFPDPGGPVKVFAHGFVKSQQTAGSGDSVFLMVVIDGDEWAESMSDEHEETGSTSTTGGSHSREWTPSGAFDVTLDLWATSANVQHLASGIHAVMMPA